MRKPTSARELAVDILERSKCLVQVGAAIEDRRGIISWGWNSVGFDGMGLHAEAHAILRANKRRLAGATIYIASMRARNNKTVISKPCSDCKRLIDKWNLHVEWRDANGEWRMQG
jgi:deoxycytidylate deaminase